jgi:hypothetical protein
VAVGLALLAGFSWIVDWHRAKGHWKKKEKRTPTYICRAHPKSTHPPFFLIAFSGVSQQVEFKNTQNSF